MPDLNVGATLPGELLAAKIVEAFTVNRASMSQANRDRLDSLLISSLERGDAFWQMFTAPLVRAMERAAQEAGRPK